MADHSQPSPVPELHGVRRLGVVGQKCKSFVTKCYSARTSSPQKIEGKHKNKCMEGGRKKAHEHHKNCSQVSTNGKHDVRCNGEGSPTAIPKHRSYDRAFMTRSSSRASSPLPHSRSTTPPPPSRNASRRSQTPIRSATRSTSARKSFEATVTIPPSMSRSTSSRTGVSPIIFSHSSCLLLKPPPIVITLQCTLEDFCFGSIKKTTITKDAVTDDGQIIQVNKVLEIEVKPEWRKGTKITFEGEGDEVAGLDHPGDVVFIIAEEQHELYRREGDNLELEKEIPLVDALCGFNLEIRLLDTSRKVLSIDEIVYPGYQTILQGQGMPRTHELGKRGDLVVTFKVEFPTKLTPEQKSELESIFQGSF